MSIELYDKVFQTITVIRIVFDYFSYKNRNSNNCFVSFYLNYNSSLIKYKEMIISSFKK